MIYIICERSPAVGWFLITAVHTVKKVFKTHSAKRVACLGESYQTVVVGTMGINTVNLSVFLVMVFFAWPLRFRFFSSNLLNTCILKYLRKACQIFLTP